MKRYSIYIRTVRVNERTFSAIDDVRCLSMAFADGLLSVRLACDDDDDDSTGELLRGGVRDTADPRSSIGRLGACTSTFQATLTRGWMDLFAEKNGF